MQKNGQYKWRGGFCLEVNALPNTIVIFGASGDLTGRKLLPALYHLAKRGLLHERSRIIGCARTVMSDEEYRNYLLENWFSSVPEQEREPLNQFLKRVFYHHGNYSDGDFYSGLDRRLKTLEEGKIDLLNSL